MLNTKVVYNSMIGPDEAYQGDLQACMHYLRPNPRFLCKELFLLEGGGLGSNPSQGKLENFHWIGVTGLDVKASPVAPG